MNPELAAALAMAQELAAAGRYESRQALFRAVNEALALDWTDAAWRGHMNRNVEVRDSLDKLLGVDEDINKAIATAVDHAPTCQSLRQLGRVVNDLLDLDWSDAKWRGVWRNRPQLKFDAEQRLGQDAKQIVKTLRLEGNYKLIVAGDFHVPYHDPNVVELLCKVTRWWKPDVGILNGDLNDFEGLSKFDPSPIRQTRAQGEVDTAKRDVLIPFRAALGSNAKAIALPGNHDDRMEKRLWTQPDLFSLRATSLPELWELQRFGYEYASFAVQFGDDLEVTHGVKVATEAGYSVKGELLRRHWSISVIMNHVHRSGSTSAKVGNRWVYGHENPCMCSLDPPYMKHANWSWGFKLAEVRNHKVNIIPVDVYNDYTCCVAGRWFGVG